MHPCDVFAAEVQRESYIREMTDDFSSVDTVKNMPDPPSTEGEDNSSGSTANNATTPGDNGGK